MQDRAELGKELLERRAKNRKIELEEAVLMKLINKAGYKYANEFLPTWQMRKSMPENSCRLTRKKSTQGQKAPQSVGRRIPDTAPRRNKLKKRCAGYWRKINQRT